MSISSIGAYNIQALSLITRLSASGSSTAGDGSSLLSLLSSGSDSLSLSSRGQWLSRAQGDNPFKADLDNLGELISSGDLASAQTAYAAMKEKMIAAPDGDDTLSTEFAAIGTALDAGDATAAQAAWATLQTSLEAFGASRVAGGSNPLKNDLDQLSTLLQSDDLSGAQALYTTIQEHLQASGQPGSQSSGMEDSFSSLLSAVGTALDAGDASTAQEALAKLEDKLSNMGAPPPPPDEASQDQASSGSTTSAGFYSISELEALLVSMYWQSSAFTNTTTSTTQTT